MMHGKVEFSFVVEENKAFILWQQRAWWCFFRMAYVIVLIVKNKPIYSISEYISLVAVKALMSVIYYFCSCYKEIIYLLSKLPLID